jgi:hypothetical protein
MGLLSKGKRRASNGDETLEMVAYDVQRNTSNQSVDLQPHPRITQLLDIPQARNLTDFINTAFTGDTLQSLVVLADGRDQLKTNSVAGLFPDVITGCVDLCMSIAENLLLFADSINDQVLADESQMREKVRILAISVLDSVYGPNCVRISVYNYEADWDITQWQLLPQPTDTPKGKLKSESEAYIQWMDLKSRLIRECRNPKREAQRLNRIEALENELQELALRHAALIDRFVKIQQGETDPEGAEAKRKELEKRTNEGD